MNRQFIIFIVVSIGIHLLILAYFTSRSQSDFSLNLKKGTTPLEVSSLTQKTSNGSPERVSKEKMVEGITDGSELGIVAPEYPREARLRGEEGTVLLLLKLTSKNELSNLEVLESSGFDDLDRAAVQTVKRSLKVSDTFKGTIEKKILFRFKIK